MELKHIDKPRPATGADAAPILNSRNATLQQMIVTNYETLKAAAYDAFPQLYFTDAEQVIERLSNKAPKRYGGPLQSTSFLAWATRWIERDTQRYRFLAKVLSEHSVTIRWAIREYLWTSALDASVDQDDVFAEIMGLVFEHAHDLKKAGKAKLSTRLVALAKTHIRLYHNHPNRRRLDLWRKYPGQVRCEFMTQTTDASMKPTAIDDNEYSAWSKHAYASA